jgi:hypothetical protein
MDEYDNFAEEKFFFEDVIKSLPIPEFSSCFEEKLIIDAAKTTRSNSKFFFIEALVNSFLQFVALCLKPKILVFEFLVVLSISIYFLSLSPQDDVMATDLISELSLATI